MSIHRFDARRDTNENDIVKALEKVGCTVERLAQPLDLLVWSPRLKAMLLIEVKSPTTGRLTERQHKFLARWPGPVFVVDSVAGALES